MQAFAEKYAVVGCAQVAEHDEETADDKEAFHSKPSADQPKRIRVGQGAKVIEHHGVGQEKADEIKIVFRFYLFDQWATQNLPIPCLHLLLFDDDDLRDDALFPFRRGCHDQIDTRCHTLAFVVAAVPGSLSAKRFGLIDQMAADISDFHVGIAH